jgi:hypothetical protein
MISFGTNYWNIGLKHSLKFSSREDKAALYRELKAACPMRDFKTEARANKVLGNLPANLQAVCEVHECTPVYLGF